MAANLGAVKGIIAVKMGQGVGYDCEGGAGTGVWL